MIVSVDPSFGRVVAAWSDVPPGDAIAAHLQAGNQVVFTDAQTVTVSGAPPAPTGVAPALAIARACAADDGQSWDDLTPDQWDADIAQANWMIRIIRHAGYTLTPIPDAGAAP